MLIKIDKINKYKNNKYKRKAILIKNRKIKNLVNELHWKTIDYLTKNYKTIIIGDMSVKSIVNNKNSNLSKMTKRIAYTLSFYKFKERLKYKCLLNNCNYSEVNEKYTSKMCSNCCTYNEILGSNKTFNCSNCNTTIDRDLNGSRNICFKYLK
jgi:putative transposase